MTILKHKARATKENFLHLKQQCISSGFGKIQSACVSKAGRKALFPGHKALHIALSPGLRTDSPENMCQTTREGQQGLTWKEKLKGGLFHSKH